MATAVTTNGKQALFSGGWIGPINQIKLYTATGTLVDTQSVTFVYVSGTQSIQPSADVVFDVAGGTNDVAYVEIGNYLPDPDGGGPAPAVFTSFYSKDLPSLYDFSTTGTLTIDNFNLTLGGSYIQSAGKAALWQTGWTTLIAWGKLYQTDNTLLDTQAKTFSSTSGVLSMASALVFDVGAGVANVTYINLGYTDGSDVVFYKRTFSAYTFVTAGTLTVNTWTITL